MTDRTNLQACRYMEDVFRMLGKRWMGQIIDLLFQRPARFNELAKALPQLSKRMLDERLTELIESGIVIREVDPGPPLAVTYSLTPHGQALEPAMNMLRAWAGAPMPEPAD